MKFYYENFIIILYIDTHSLNLHFQDIITIPNLSVGLVQVTLDQYGCHDDLKWTIGTLQLIENIYYSLSMKINFKDFKPCQLNVIFYWLLKCK